MSDALLDALSAELGALLSARGWRVTTAESCTGGMVAAAITATAGSSGWFDIGYVSYSDGAKQALLGVAAAVLATHGAVSEATAIAMAEGALARSGANLAVGVTGIAGPSGGSAKKPVGMVCLAWAATGRATQAATRQFGGDRRDVRHASAVAALKGLIEAARN